MKKILHCLIAICFCYQTDASTIKITCRSKGCELQLAKDAIDDWIKETEAQTRVKHKVEIVSLPHASNECFALYQQWFSAGSFDIDILQMDVAWIGVFADHLAAIKDNEINVTDYFDAIRASMHKDGKIIALPWYTDCGIMYYRLDLLKQYNRPVPTTWEELFETALYIQTEVRKDVTKKNRFYGFVFQAKAFECLTCNAVEFFDSFGGAIIENGKVLVNSQRCIDAVQFMVGCMDNISSSSVLNYNEEDSRGMFQSGNAVFMRNWPYAWSLLNNPSTEVSGKVAVMPIPKSKNGGKNSGVLGGWFLSASKYSKNKELAINLIKYLTSKQQQKIRSQYSYLPAFKSLYKDEFVLRNNPFFETIYASLDSAVARPSIAFGKQYAKASNEIFSAINSILTDNLEAKVHGSIDLKRYLDRLDKKLENILHKKLKFKKKDDSNLAEPGICGYLWGTFLGSFSWIFQYITEKLES